MADLLLRAKHWQLLSLWFVTYLIGVIGVLNSAGTTTSLGRAAKMEVPIALSTLPFVASLFGWLWSIGSFLNSIVSSHLRLRFWTFELATIYAGLYCWLGLIFFFFYNPTGEKLLVVLHFAAILSLLYLYYFIARALAAENKNRTVHFNDYALNLFLLFFLPIGLWTIQPRVNQLYVEKLHHRNDD